MSTIRVVRRDRWTTVATEAIEDGRLSFRARGILVWLLAKPDGWSVNSSVIADQGKEGRDAIRTALGELEEVGYLVRECVRAKDGTLGTVSTVYEEPPAPRNPTPVKPTPDNPSPEIDTQELDTTPPSPPRGAQRFPTLEQVRLDRSLYPPEFEECWQQYPWRKGTKEVAYKQWRARVLEAPKCKPPVTIERRIQGLLIATQNYASEQLARDEPEYCKRAETFYGPGNHWKGYTKRVVHAESAAPWSASRANG